MDVRAHSKRLAVVGAHRRMSMRMTTGEDKQMQTSSEECNEDDEDKDDEAYNYTHTMPTQCMCTHTGCGWGRGDDTVVVQRGDDDESDGWCGVVQSVSAHVLRLYRRGEDNCSAQLHTRGQVGHAEDGTDHVQAILKTHR